MKSTQLALVAVLLSGALSACNSPEPAAPAAEAMPAAAEPAVATEPATTEPAAADPATTSSATDTAPADAAGDGEDVDTDDGGIAPHSGGDKVGNTPAPAPAAGN